MSDCIFCRIIGREIPAEIVYEDASVIAFLDTHPLFPGHLLVVPKTHYVTLADLPEPLLTPLFRATQLLTRAVETGLAAGGSFVANNNRVSQTVHHLHVHVVPRTKGDGLKGFFWPRHAYRHDEHRTEVANALRKAVAGLTASS